MQVNMRQSAQRSRSLMVNAAKMKSKARALLAKKLPRPKVSLHLHTPPATAAATTRVLSAAALHDIVRTLYDARSQLRWRRDGGWARVS